MQNANAYMICASGKTRLNKHACLFHIANTENMLIVYDNASRFSAAGELCRYLFY